MLKDENEKDIQEKIDEFLREIDALYPAKWSKLQYEKYNLEEKNDDRNYDNVILEFKRDKNSIRKIRYLSRLSTAKIVDLKDSFKFNISIPKEGKLIIKEIEECHKKIRHLPCLRISAVHSECLSSFSYESF